MSTTSKRISYTPAQLLRLVITLTLWPLAICCLEWVATREFIQLFTRMVEVWGQVFTTGWFFILVATAAGMLLIEAFRSRTGRYTELLMLAFLGAVYLSGLCPPDEDGLGAASYCLSFAVSFILFSGYFKLAYAIRDVKSVLPAAKELFSKRNLNSVLATTLRLALSILLWPLGYIVIVTSIYGFLGTWSGSAFALLSPPRLAEVWAGLLQQSGWWVVLEVILAFVIVELLRRRLGIHSLTLLVSLLFLIGAANISISESTMSVVPASPLAFVSLVGANYLLFYLLGAGVRLAFRRAQPRAAALG